LDAFASRFHDDSSGSPRKIDSRSINPPPELLSEAVDDMPDHDVIDDSCARLRSASLDLWLSLNALNARSWFPGPRR
jgi:hypothetical protein